MDEKRKLKCKENEMKIKGWILFLSTRMKFGTCAFVIFVCSALSEGKWWKFSYLWSSHIKRFKGLESTSRRTWATIFFEKQVIVHDIELGRGVVWSHIFLDLRNIISWNFPAFIVGNKLVKNWSQDSWTICYPFSFSAQFRTKCRSLQVLSWIIGAATISRIRIQAAPCVPSLWKVSCQHKRLLLFLEKFF